MNLSLIIFLILLSILSLYTPIYFIGALLINFVPRKIKSFGERDHGSVAVLIPSYNEGAGLVDAIKSIVNQDYIGLINIYILLKDENDNSYRLVQEYEDQESFDNIKVNIVLSGESRKRENINRVLPSLDEQFIAFLDADHRADREWISSSLAILDLGDADVIQSVRRPLSLSHFFQIWDSIQNHIGNEAFNRIYSWLNLNTFFTGTTCIFKSELFEKRLLPDSITEDTALSYDLLLEGRRIGYNGDFGSYEEVAPNFSSFISRRRRWSNGHSQVLMKSFFKILRAKIDIKHKVHLLLHGCYYLLALPLIISSHIIGWYYFLQYTTTIQQIVLLLIGFGALSFAMLRYRNIVNFIFESFLAAITISPIISMLSVFFYKVYKEEYYYSVLSFPYYKVLIVVVTIMTIAPMSILFFGRRFSKRLSFIVFLTHFLFYPLILIVDIYSSLLGLIDLIAKDKDWGIVKRTNRVDVDLIPASLVKTIAPDALSTRKRYKILVFPFLIGLLIFINDFFVFHNCGDPSYLFNDYILYKREDLVTADIKVKTKSLENGKYELIILPDVVNQYDVAGSIKIFHNDEIIISKKLQEKLNPIRYIGDMGWKKNKVELHIETNKFSCLQKKNYSTSIKEIKENKFFLNGQPFLIKCIIPSFKESETLSMSDGIKQIKSAGANCIRVYHSPSESLLNIAAENDMLIISQPTDTTWENIKIYKNEKIKKLTKEYRDHSRYVEGNPYVLFNVLGNELELNRFRDRSIKNLKESMVVLKSRGDGDFLSYSTFLTYVKYPVNILGVNMLDSGDVYWKNALSLLQEQGTPFYASELGGFVAFFEKTPVFLRVDRLYRQWEALLAKGAMGAVFFQSHDNWAQPVAQGYNNPFEAELPDDLRGFWDNENNEKKELRHLKNILSDFDFKYEGNSLIIKSRREYTLNRIKMTINEKQYSFKELKPREEYRLNIEKADVFDIKAQYETHIKLKHNFSFSFDPTKGMRESSFKKRALPNVFLNKSGDWINFKENYVDRGELKIKIKFPENLDGETFLFFNGIGSQELSISNPTTGYSLRWKVHSYREQFIRIKSLREKLGEFDELIIIINRQHVDYLSPNKHNRKPIATPLARPFLMGP